MMFCGRWTHVCCSWSSQSRFPVGPDHPRCVCVSAREAVFRHVDERTRQPASSHRARRRKIIAAIEDMSVLRTVRPACHRSYRCHGLSGFLQREVAWVAGPADTQQRMLSSMMASTYWVDVFNEAAPFVQGAISALLQMDRFGTFDGRHATGCCRAQAWPAAGASVPCPRDSFAECGGQCGRDRTPD